MERGMATGVVKSFNEKKGCGFIQQDDGEEIFVHHTAINMLGFRTLHEGDRVTFEIGAGHKGPAAVNVEKI